VSSFPDQLGLIGVGEGRVVLPAPEIDPSWNQAFRGYADGTFKWGLVTGAEPSPDLGYVYTPADHYQIELTPDLGWGNEEVLFDPYVAGEGNSRLIVVGNLVVGEDLVVTGDGTCTYAVPESVMKRLLAPGFENYLWRVRAVSPQNHPGHPSLIQRFRGRVAVVHLGWTVDPVQETARGVTAIIHGKREPSIASIEVNGVSAHTTFPSPTTWQIDVPLSPGRNMLYLRAFDSQGNGSEYRHVEIDLTKKDLEQDSYFNRFDDFGYKMALKRLPGERNLDYRRRIMDVLVHRASPTYPGLMNAVARELDLTYDDQAILLDAAAAPAGSRYIDVVVWLTASHFYAKRTGVISKLEHHTVEGRSWRVRPDLYMEGGDVLVERAPGSPIPPSAYRIERDTDGFPIVQFVDPSMAGSAVYLTYSYALRIEIAGKTVNELISEINALTLEGRQFVTATLGDDMVGTRRAEGLQHFAPTVLGLQDYRTAGNETVTAVPVRWVEAELDAFCDEDFKRLFRNEHGSLFGTKYASWAEQLRGKMKSSWGYLVADSSCWSAPWMRMSGLGSLDTIYDAYVGSWATTRGGAAYSLHPSVAFLRWLVDPRDGSKLAHEGIPYEWMMSGIGFGLTLLAYIEDEFETDASEEEESVVRQVVEGELPSFEELGIGANEVDSEVP
jgi:hypothetical protein